MNIEGYKAHAEAYQGIAKNLGDTVDELLKEKAELEARLTATDAERELWTKEQQHLKSLLTGARDAKRAAEEIQLATAAELDEANARLAEAEGSRNTWEEWAKKAWDDIGNLQDERRELISRAEKAEAENKRLRAALEKIAKHDFLAEQDKTGMTLMSQVGLIREIAKAALAEQPGESDPYSAGEIVADARRARRNHQR